MTICNECLLHDYCLRSMYKQAFCHYNNPIDVIMDYKITTKEWLKETQTS